MPVVTIHSNFKAVLAKMADMEAVTPIAMMAGLDAAAHGIADAVVPIIKAHTPIAPIDGGTLRDSTAADIAVTENNAIITISQPAENADGVHYVQWVIEGRGDVYPVTKKALAGPNFGPVAHAGPAAPNDYITPAMDEAAPAIETALTVAAEGVAHAIVTGT